MNTALRHCMMQLAIFLSVHLFVPMLFPTLQVQLYPQQKRVAAPKKPSIVWASHKNHPVKKIFDQAQPISIMDVRLLLDIIGNRNQNVQAYAKFFKWFVQAKDEFERERLNLRLRDTVVARQDYLRGLSYLYYTDRVSFRPYSFELQGFPTGEPTYERYTEWGLNVALWFARDVELHFLIRMDPQRAEAFVKKHYSGDKKRSVNAYVLFTREGMVLHQGVDHIADITPIAFIYTDDSGNVLDILQFRSTQEE